MCFSLRMHEPAGRVVTPRAPRTPSPRRLSSLRASLRSSLLSLLALLALTTTLSCGPRAAQPTTPPRASGPGLVVLLIIDQFPQWAFEQKRAELTAGGFQRLLSEGKWHVGEYPYAMTLTAPGHAMIGSGAPPSQSGILSNEWFRRGPGRRLKSIEAENGDVSPKWLRVPALGDAIAAAGTGAKAVSVALKDRAAVLPLGHAGTAVWYEPKTVDWLSTTSPPWLAAWNRSHPMAFHLHHVWEPLDAERLRRVTGRRDDEPGEAGDGGLKGTFPHRLDKAKTPAEALLNTPLGNQLVLDTALAAVDGEQLGADAAPDLLIVSLSSYDYVAHAWGHESWELWDTALRLDQQLAAFLGALDAKVGADRWAMLVTSDHGGSPLPELVGGGRMLYEQIEKLANDAASTVLGEGHWIADPKFPSMYLTEEAHEQPADKRELAIDAIIAALRAAPAIGRVERTSVLAGNCEARSGEDLLICRGLDAAQSGEIFYAPKPGWVFQDAKDPVATSHGTVHDYDRLVPILTLPFGRAAHPPLTAPDGGRLSLSEVSTIVATWLGVTPPLQMPRAASATAP